MQWRIDRREVTGSTNEDAALAGERGEAAGYVCAADCQTAGRGRLGRQWFSPKGRGLYVSVLVRPRIPPEAAGLLSFCAAEAMTLAVRGSGLAEAGIKWPNDVVCRGKKICGILSACRQEKGVLSFAVIGSGLNLFPGSYPEELGDRASCLAEMGVRPDRERLLSDYLSALDASLSDLEQKGPESLIRRVSALCLTLNRPVRVSGGMELTGVARAIGPGGELMVETPDGALLPVLAGDVSVRGLMGYC